jgi:hypothetical protein
MAILSRVAGPLLALAVMIAVTATAAPGAPVSEAQVRAAMVYNFASYTEWPGPTAQEQPLVIGVIGNDAVALALQASGRLGSGREIDVQSLSASEELSRCQVLYVSGIADRVIAATLAKVSGMPVLTIGEQDHFTQLGGIIRVYSEGNRLRFEVNMTHASGVRLKISSRVLDLARLVRNPDAKIP